jgi:drug/metabolite transporter (DMT)-like permease
MRQARAATTAGGLALLLPYPVLSALVDVYAGHGEQTLDPAVVAAVAFTLTVAVFAAFELVTRTAHPPPRPPAPLPPAPLPTAPLPTAAGRRMPGGLRVPGAGPVRTVRAHPGDVLAINISTALTWIALLYALKFLEPAVVNAVSLAIGPAVTAMASPVLRRGTSVLGAEAAVSAAVLAVIVLLCWGSAAGLSSIGHLSPGRAAAGLAVTLISGLGSAGTFIYAKRLSEAGVSPASVLSSRFWLTAAAAWVIAAASHVPQLAASLVPGAVVAVVGVAVPAYLLQLGIRYTEPITISLLDNLAPLLTYLLQFLDGRLRPSAFSLMGILTITGLITTGIVVRARHDAVPAQAGGTVGAASSRGART